MKKVYFLALFFASCLGLIAQIDEERQWKFIGQLDNRYSSISRNDIFIFGMKAGVQFENLFRAGVGGSVILEPVRITSVNQKSGNEEENTMQFWYGSVFGEMIVLKNERWEIFVTNQFGFGSPNFKKRIDDEIVVDVNTNIYINEVSGQLNYTIRPWLGVGAGIGYRNVINNSGEIRRSLNAPVYLGKLIIYPRYFIKKRKAVRAKVYN